MATEITGPPETQVEHTKTDDGFEWWEWIVWRPGKEDGREITENLAEGCSHNSEAEAQHYADAMVKAVADWNERTKGTQ